MSLEILSLVGKDRLFEISVYGVVRAFKKWWCVVDLGEKDVVNRNCDSRVCLSRQLLDHRHSVYLRCYLRS